MARIPLQVASRSLDTGGVVQYPSGSPLGAAMEGFGDAMQQAAAHRRALDEKQDAFDAAILDDEFRATLAQQETDALEKAPADGKGLHDQVYGELDPATNQPRKPGLFDQLFDKFLQRVPESQRQKWAAQRDTLRINGSTRLALVQKQKRIAYEAFEVVKAEDKFLNEIIQADPDDKAAFEQFKKAGADLIANMSDPSEREKAAYDWEQKSAKALAKAMINKDPSQVRALLGMEPKSEGSATVGSVVDRIIGVESGGNASARNPRSSAAGLGQFIDSTWLKMVRTYRPDVAAGKSAAQIIALKTDPALSRQMTEAYTNENAEYLKNRGVQTTAGNLYLAHFAGPAGAVQVLKADPNASVASVLGQDKVRANPFLAGMTARDLAAWADKKMGGAGGGNVAPDPRLAGLSPDDRLSLAGQADRAMADIRGALRAELDLAITNAPIAIQNTGQYSGSMPTREQFDTAYGPQEGAERFNRFQTAVETSQQAFAMQTMPESAIRSMLAEAEPASSGNTASLDQARYETLTTAAERVLKARAADPAGYVQRMFPSVASAWENVGQDGGLQRAVAASVAAQQQLGIANIQPLAASVVDGAVSSFKNEQRQEADRVGAVSNLLMATDDPTQRKAIFEQMVKAGLPEITEGAFRALERGDAGAAQNLFTAAMVDVSTLPGSIDATPEKIDDAVQSQVMDDGMVGDIFYGLSDGSVESFIPAQRDSKLLSNAVNLRMRKGETLEQAVDGAAADLFGDVKPVVEDNVKILLPANEDADVVVAGLQALMPQVQSALEEKIVNNGTRRPFLTNPVVHEVARNQVPLVMSEGYFRNAGDGYVFIDPYTGDAVSDMNDQPIIFRPVPEAELPAPVSGAPVSPATDPAFEQRTPETGAGPSLDENGNPVVLGQ